MNENCIAIVKLAPGNVGWYDKLTGLHLTIAHPTAEVRQGYDLKGIKKAVAFKTIEVIEGTLSEAEIIKNQAQKEVVTQAVEDTHITQVAQAVEDTQTSVEAKKDSTEALPEEAKPKKKKAAKKVEE